jgi:benzoate/toluate 1,2-dioxygenase beta subunit
MATAVKQDPSLSSYYVSNEFYDALTAAFSGWVDDARQIHAPGHVAACQAVLLREARYLEELKLEDWLGLFAAECAYWVPGTAERGDPRREITITFDDRRRLEDRVYRLRLAHAWSQRPPSRTVRQITNVECFAADDKNITMVRSNFLISEFWDGETRAWAGWCGHRLGRKGKGFEILAKQVNLINCDQNLRNPSIIL